MIGVLRVNPSIDEILKLDSPFLNMFNDFFFFKPLYSDGFPIYIYTISMGLPIVPFKGQQVKVLNYDVFLFLKACVISANHDDTDEMQFYTAFHLGHHCL